MLEAIKSNYIKGVRQQVVSAVVGSGKTVTFANIPSFMEGTLPGQTMVLAHTDELVTQAIAKISALNPGLKVTREMASEYADVGADIIVASVATLGRKGSKRADRFNWNNITKIITDECHHATGSLYGNIYERADVLRPDTHKLHVGFTATPNRADGEGLHKVFQKIVFSYPMRTAIEEGYLCEPKGIRVRTGTSLDGVKVTAGDYNQQELADTVNTPQRNQTIVKTWCEHAATRKTIIFSVDIQHAKDIAEMFTHYGYKAAAVWGVDPERKQKLAQFAQDDLQIIVNAAVLTEGYDQPDISCVVLAAPTKSGVRYTQCIGRGTRLFPGKQDCIVIDVVDSSSRNTLVTLPTLLGMAANLDLKGQGLVFAAKKLEEEAKKYPNVDFSQLEDLSKIDQYVEEVNLFDVKFPPEVENNSELTWHPGPFGDFVLLLPNQDKMTICHNVLDQWEIAGNIKGVKYKGQRDTIEAAFAAADSLIGEKCAEEMKILQRKQKWHRAPATEAQLNLLRKFLKGKPLPLDIDKGMASRLIGSFLAGKG